MTDPVAHVNEVHQQRHELLEHFSRATDKLMVALALVWIGLMIKALVGTLSHWMVILNDVIWALFIVDFLVKLILAPHRKLFLRQHWTTAISLVLPAFRVIRIFQALGALQAVSLLRMLTALNRAMGELNHAMGQRGTGYVVAVTLLVLFAGAAGMYEFEKPATLIHEGFQKTVDAGGGTQSYLDGLWWTFMLMTTIGSQYWPVTNSGRTLCFFLSLYSLGVFGYITALIASFLVGKDNGQPPADPETSEIAALRAEIQALGAKLDAVIGKNAK